MKDVVICVKSRGGDKQPSIRESPNEETLPLMWKHVAEYIGYNELTLGSETSQYQEEKKIIMIPLVVASEKGKAQTHLSVTYSDVLVLPRLN